MKYLKMLGLAAVAAMALMAFAGAGSASATILTCTNPENVKVQCPVGTEIDASVDKSIQLTGAINPTCTEGTVKGKVEDAGSSTTTVKGLTSAVTFVISSCTSCTKIEVSNGTLEIHTDKEGVVDGNGTLTGSGFTATLTCFGVTCKYETRNNNDLGTLTGSSTTKGTATMDVNATLFADEPSFLCGGSGATAIWEGNYIVTSPDWLDVD